MVLFCQIVFFISALGVLHSYVFYPLLLRILAIGRSNNSTFYQTEEDLPQVSVVMAVYNEEQVIAEKMRSLLELDYPTDRLDIYIGSDCSSDDSNAILTQLSQIHSNIHFYPFTERQGKPGVVNTLMSKLSQRKPVGHNHLLLLTDANVILRRDTLFMLVRHFRQPEIMLVDAHMISTGMQAEGISKIESQYVSNEVRLKHLEGIVFGKMIGPFGGCYVLRSSHFSPVPPKFLVDDFFIAMRAFEKGGRAINELDAVCFEAVSHDISEEYRRKSRISAGNFQNLSTFRHLLWRFDALSFAFFSHKVLRWLGPFFLIFMLLSSGVLMLLKGQIWGWIFPLLLGGLLLVPAFDILLKQLGINVLILRSIRYFIMMNIALLEGFFKYIKGVKNNVWQPPKRH